MEPKSKPNSTRFGFITFYFLTLLFYTAVSSFLAYLLIHLILFGAICGFTASTVFAYATIQELTYCLTERCPSD